MADRSINRDAWAALVARLVEEEARGNKSEFGRMVGVQFQTVSRWIKGTNDVSEESVRSVARAINLRPMDLLLEVGYYDHKDMPGEAAMPPASDEDAEAVELISGADIPPSARRSLIGWLEDQRREDARRRVDLIRRMLEHETRRAA